MKYAIDFDGTLIKVDKDLTNIVPIKKNVDKVNKLYDDGNEIIIYTARGMLSTGSKTGAEAKYKEKVKNVLKNIGVKYHRLVFGKEYANFYVDDLSVHANNFDKRLNVLYGKLGRPIVFDEFGSSGGHYECLGQIKILSQFCNVFLFGVIKGDIPFDNVQMFEYDKHKDGMDFCMLDNGVTSQSELASVVDKKVLKNSDDMIKVVEDLNINVMYSLTDPRLVYKHRLFKTYSQNDKEATLHQDKLCLLTLPFIDSEKKYKCVIVARKNNYNSKIYDEFITKLRELDYDVDVYGNIDLSDNKDVLKGEVRADEIYKCYSESMFSFMLPIEPGWITQKYCESLHFNCLPLLYKYDEKKLFFDDDDSLFKSDILRVDKNGAPSISKRLAHLRVNRLKEKLYKYYRMDYWVDLYSSKINTFLEVIKNESK